MNERKAFWILLATVGATLLLTFLVHASHEASSLRQVATTGVSRSVGIEIVSSDENGLQLVLATHGFELTSDGQVASPGLEQTTQEPGAPALPFYSTLVALPPGATVSATIREHEISTTRVEHVPPAPRPVMSADSDDLAVGDAYAFALNEDARLGEPASLEYVADPAFYGRGELYPPMPYSVSEPMYARDLRLVELRLYPLRFNPQRQTVRESQRLEIILEFVGVRQAIGPRRPSAADWTSNAVRELVVNFDQSANWRELPEDVRRAQATSLPIGADLYKIELNKDGIYEISGAELLAAGMVITDVNPNTIEMSYRGHTVAYQFIGDADSILESNERVRFYGWAFSGPISETQFVTDNVFWLWANGTPTSIATVPNQAGTGLPVDTDFLSTVTREPENHFFATWTLWDGFPNEPDAWYWDYLNQVNERVYSITMPYPVSSGPDASFLVEMFSRKDYLPPAPPHEVEARFSGSQSVASKSWYGLASVNLTSTVPLTDLANGRNDISITVSTALPDQLYLNRIAVEYLRELIAQQDQLFFSDEIGGSREFHVAEVNQGDASKVLVWNISEPRLPVQIELTSGDVIAGSSSFTYTVGVTNTAPGSSYLLTSLSNVITGERLSQYNPPSLEPPASGAEWLAITHSDFMTEAQRLANHRSDPDFGGKTAYVVDVEDVFNQYGYGMPLPEAIRSYLKHALSGWSPAPEYVVLFGDATQNPRNLDCLSGCNWWDKDEPTFVLTDLVFEDRFQGLIPTDHTFAMLSGPDLLPDMAIGRIPAATIAEATAVVDKIITYESNQFAPASWQQNFLFLADDLDPQAGNFCDANKTTGDTKVPDGIEQIHLCMDPNGPITNNLALRAAMDPYINNTGVTVVNYRGHGSVHRWAGQLEPILSTSTTGFWQNAGKPVTILSADCLDGHFAWPGNAGLGEVFLKLADRGSVANWSSSGLGTDNEHTVLHAGFMEGIFAQGLTAIGDAINYAKMAYAATPNHYSELYSFILLGDPAMQLMRPNISLDKTGPQGAVHPGESVEFALTVSNVGIYPALLSISDTIPAGLSFLDAVGSAPIATNVNQGTVSIDMLLPLARGNTETITITAVVSPSFLGNATNTAVVTNIAANLSGTPSLSDSALVTVTDAPISGLAAHDNGPTIQGSLTTVSATLLAGTNVSYQWQFGDGHLGSGEITGHVYEAIGVYTATVTASNSSNFMTATTQVRIYGPHVTYLPVISQP